MGSDRSRLLEHEKYEALRALAATLNGISDLDAMLEAVLSEARRFVKAEAGSIYVPDGRRLLFAYSQNDFFSRRDDGDGAASYKNQELSLVGNSLASYVARENVTLNIPEAYDIPLEAPYRFEPVFDHLTGYLTRSVLTLPLNNARGEVMGVLQVINRQEEGGETGPFDQDDEELMQIFSSTAAMAMERVQLIRRMLLRTVKISELRDPLETASHAQRVGALSGFLYEKWARARQLDSDEIRRNVDHLRLAAMMHDIGKVGVPDMVLNKPSRLEPAERLEMEKHVLIGYKLFDPCSSDLDQMIREVILSHHERWDGQGYPGWVDPETGRPLPDHLDPEGRVPGKKAEEISIFGRVTAVADVFDALSSRRVYKEAFDEDLVCQIMLQESGRHFDPELVDLLLNNLDQAKSIRKRFPE
jgi:Response regulator containing a CheY-like receiver domain and an HD-GYP domain